MDDEKREPPLVITGDEPLPRSPVEDPQEESELQFYLDVLRNFMVVNGLVMMGTLFMPVFRPTMGATASSRLDPETGKPAVMELRGCTVTQREIKAGS
jgi:hypothetical protein